MKAQQARDRPRRGEIVLGSGQGLGADEDDFMAESRDKLRQGGEKDKKMKKKAPNNNGPRAPYASFASKADEGEGEVAAASVPAQEEPVKPVVRQTGPKPKAKVISF